MTTEICIPAKWYELMLFQLNISERWHKRGNESTDPFAQFFFYFAGFNALYFLWSRIDDIKNEQGQPAGEGRQISHLMQRLSDQKAELVIRELQSTLDYFSSRPPIQRMDKRTQESASIGDAEEGKKWRRQLRAGKTCREQLIALGRILYLVRSNLVHGSKAESGDDKEIVVNSVHALKVLLEQTIALTKGVERVS